MAMVRWPALALNFANIAKLHFCASSLQLVMMAQLAWRCPIRILDVAQYAWRPARGLATMINRNVLIHRLGLSKIRTS